MRPAAFELLRSDKIIISYIWDNKSNYKKYALQFITQRTVAWHSQTLNYTKQCREQQRCNANAFNINAHTRKYTEANMKIKKKSH